MTESLELSDKGYKAAIKKMFQLAIRNILETWKKINEIKLTRYAQ